MEQEAIFEKEFNIPSCHMEELARQFAILTKKATKLGCPAPTFQIVNTFNRTFTEHPLTGNLFLTPLVVEYTKIMVTGQVLKYEGWMFIGTIEHHPETSINIVRAVPGFELNPFYRTDDPTCNHCHTSRNRKNTYVVRHTDGSEKRVGSACVGDFLGHLSPEKVAAQLELFFKLFRILEDEGRWNEGLVYKVSTIHFLTVAACMIRSFGWVSRTAESESDGRKVATASDVAMYIDSDGEAAKEMRRDHPITNEDVEVANKALNWAQTLTETSSDYLYNIQAISLMDTLERKHYGFAASIVSSYLREVERLNFQRVQRETSEWIGVVGQRLDFEALCVSIRSYDGNFGTTYICKFIRDGRDQITWFSTNPPSFDENIIVKLKGTVKEHTEYHEIKQTVVTRCKVISSRPSV